MRWRPGPKQISPPSLATLAAAAALTGGLVGCTDSPTASRVQRGDGVSAATVSAAGDRRLALSFAARDAATRIIGSSDNQDMRALGLALNALADTLAHPHAQLRPAIAHAADLLDSLRPDSNDLAPADLDAIRLVLVRGGEL